MSVDQGRATDQTTRIEYEKPPIVEALSQFNFAAPIAWSPILPGMFYERIRAEYPTDPEVQQQVQANVQFPNDAAGQAQFTVGQGDQRLLYRNASLDRLVVLSPSTISVNSVPPYEGWPSLSERFERLLTKTKDLLRGTTVGAVSVRYINRIFVPGLSSRELGDYFSIPFRTVGGAEADATAIFQRVEAVQADASSQGVLTFVSVELQEDESDGQAFLLDIEFRRELAEPVEFDQALGVAHELKLMENAEFEDCITDRTRELFR